MFLLDFSIFKHSLLTSTVEAQGLALFHFPIPAVWYALDIALSLLHDTHFPSVTLYWNFGKARVQVPYVTM